jgi:hypothetical protein
VRVSVVLTAEIKWMQCTSNGKLRVYLDPSLTTKVGFINFDTPFSNLHVLLSVICLHYTGSCLEWMWNFIFHIRETEWECLTTLYWNRILGPAGQNVTGEWRTFYSGELLTGMRRIMTFSVNDGPHIRRWSHKITLTYAGLWYPRSRVRTRPKPSDFSGEKILSMPSFGREVKPFAPCRRFAACQRIL